MVLLIERLLKTHVSSKCRYYFDIAQGSKLIDRRSQANNRINTTIRSTDTAFLTLVGTVGLVFSLFVPQAGIWNGDISNTQAPELTMNKALVHPKNNPKLQRKGVSTNLGKFNDFTYLPRNSSPMQSPELVHSISSAQALGVLPVQQVALHRIVVAQLESTTTVLSCNIQPAAELQSLMSVIEGTST